jgi:hypothetical protein
MDLREKGLLEDYKRQLKAPGLLLGMGVCWEQKAQRNPITSK